MRGSFLPPMVSNSPRFPAPRPLALATGLLLLAACNGGGGGGAPPANNSGNNPPANGGGNPQPAAPFVHLWVPNYNAGELRGWSFAATQADRDNAPDVVLTLPADSRPNAIAFDATGALWVTDSFGARLFKFGRSQLGSSGAPVPLVTIESDGTSLQNAIGLAFDGSANLWVAAGGRIEMYQPDNLDASGPTTPNRVLSTGGLDIPAGLTFDTNGNLWLTNASFTPANNSVLAFAPDQLAAGGVQTPRLTIRSLAFSLVEGIRFDAGGDLWVASNDGLNLARFARLDLVVQPMPQTLTLVPAASLEADADDTPTGRSIRKPGGIAFAANGNLFVNSERGANGGGDSGVLRFAAADLAFAGSVAKPAGVVIARSTSNPGFGGLAFELP